VLGANGGGVLDEAALTPAQVPLLMGTLGKACGSFGAFVAGERDLIDYILQRARSYIFTTALPPAVAAATRAALRILQQEPWRRARLQALIARFRSGAAAAGITVADSRTPIQPLILGDAALCLRASSALRDAGYWVSAIRPPTVPPGTERLRITLSAAHTEAEVDGLVAALSAVLPPRPTP
jgi:8-amino-7-oxononanoate synthase